MSLTRQGVVSCALVIGQNNLLSQDVGNGPALAEACNRWRKSVIRIVSVFAVLTLAGCGGEVPELPEPDWILPEVVQEAVAADACSVLTVTRANEIISSADTQPLSSVDLHGEELDSCTSLACMATRDVHSSGVVCCGVHTAAHSLFGRGPGE